MVVAPVAPDIMDQEGTESGHDPNRLAASNTNWGNPLLTRGKRGERVLDSAGITSDQTVRRLLTAPAKRSLSTKAPPPSDPAGEHSTTTRCNSVPTGTVFLNKF